MKQLDNDPVSPVSGRRWYLADLHSYAVSTDASRTVAGILAVEWLTEKRALKQAVPMAEMPGDPARLQFVV